MPTNTFNVGKDCSLVLVTGTGQTVALSLVTGFDAKQQTHSIRVKPLTGPPQGADLPDGWDYSFEIERGTSAADDLIASVEQGYWNGGALGVGQIFQYVSEVNGSQSTYRFDGVTMKLDAGKWTADASVKQMLTGFASTRVRI